MSKFTTAPRNALSDVMTLRVMAGLTIASAAALALPLGPQTPAVVLPTVVVTAKSPRATEAVRLPTVVVVAKRGDNAS